MSSMKSKFNILCTLLVRMTVMYFTAIVAQIMMLVWKRKDSVTIVACRTGGGSVPVLDGYRHTISCGVELSCSAASRLWSTCPHHYQGMTGSQPRPEVPV